MKTYKIRLSADLPMMEVTVANGAEFERAMIEGTSMLPIRIDVSDEDFKVLLTFAKRHCENFGGSYYKKMHRCSWYFQCQHHTQGLTVRCSWGDRYVTIEPYRPFGGEWSLVGAPDRNWIK